MKDETMTTLTEFLLARIAEDEEAAARAAGAMRWQRVPRWIVGESNNDGIRRDDDIPVTRHTWPNEADHIVRWDPARVLAECEAKRRIVEKCDAAVGDDDWDDGNVPTFADEILRLLAVAYADHPDFDEAWRP